LRIQIQPFRIKADPDPGREAIKQNGTYMTSSVGNFVQNVMQLKILHRYGFGYSISMHADPVRIQNRNAAFSIKLVLTSKGAITQPLLTL
jgi:hypothetical protein